MGPGLTRNIFLVENLHKITPVLIFWSSIPCVFCLYTLLKFVGYYDLSILSMSVMGFQKKKFGWVWVGGVSYIQFFGDFRNFFNFAKSLIQSRRYKLHHFCEQWNNSLGHLPIRVTWPCSFPNNSLQ